MDSLLCMRIRTGIHNQRVCKLPIVCVTLGHRISRCSHTVVDCCAEGYDRVTTENCLEYMYISTGSGDSGISLSPVVRITSRLSRFCRFSMHVNRQVQGQRGIATGYISQCGLIITGGGIRCTIPCECIALNRGGITGSRFEQREMERCDQILTHICIVMGIDIITGSITILSTPHHRCALGSNSILCSSRYTRQNIYEVITIKHIAALGSNDITQGDIRFAAGYRVWHIQPCTADIHLPFSIGYRHCQVGCIRIELSKECFNGALSSNSLAIYNTRF